MVSHLRSFPPVFSGQQFHRTTAFQIFQSNHLYTLLTQCFHLVPAFHDLTHSLVVLVSEAMSLRACWICRLKCLKRYRDLLVRLCWVRSRMEKTILGKIVGTRGKGAFSVGASFQISINTVLSGSVGTCSNYPHGSCSLQMT